MIDGERNVDAKNETQGGQRSGTVNKEICLSGQFAKGRIVKNAESNEEKQLQKNQIKILYDCRCRLYYDLEENRER